MKREVIRGYVGSEIEFSPIFLPQIKKEVPEKGSQISLPILDAEYYRKLGEQRKTITKKNIARYFVQLYASIYGGEVSPEFKHTYEHYANGHRKFHPDITKRTRYGKQDIEVKAANNCSRLNWLGVKQLENYVHNNLQNLEEGLNESTIDYVFFRYGPYYNKSHLKLASLTNSKLKKELSEDLNTARRDLLVIPSNLLLFMLSTSKYNKKQISRENSNGIDSADYWLMKSGGISQLHKGLSSIDHFLEYSFSPEESRELFMLDSLKVEHSTTPEEVYCKGHKVRPFKVTRYFLPKQQLREWNKHFRENHKQILNEIGLRDLHQAEQDSKKREERLRAIEGTYLDDDDWDDLVSPSKRGDISSLAIDLNSKKVPF